MSHQSILVSFVVLLALTSWGCGGNTPPQQSNPVPSIISIAPSHAAAGTGGATIDVVVANLMSASTIQWNGVPRTPSSVNPNGFTLIITAADLSEAGSASLTVTNPAPGGGTATYAFIIDPPAAPVLTAVSPSSIPPIATPSNLTVAGSNFVRASVVNWNGSARTTTYLSHTQLTAVLNSQDSTGAGMGQVTVSTPSPGGGTSQAQAVKLEYPLPIVESLSPATGTWDSTSAFTLTVNGSDFFP